MPRRADLSAQTGKAVHHVLQHPSDGLLQRGRVAATLREGSGA
jgi:hypothetical protein